MNIKEVTASYSRKVQLEQFEPIEVHSSVTAELEGEDVEEAYDELYSLVRDNVERKLTHRLAAKRMEDEDE